jgi:hypothetical protein
MIGTARRYAIVLLALALLGLGLPTAFADGGGGKLVYSVRYASEDSSTPTAWYNSSYFDNPVYKENRFVQYWVETPIAPGGPRDTGFYMTYNEEGLTMFFQMNEPERDADGILRPSSLELFLQTGPSPLPYHQMIIHTDGTPTEYYEWQTENRHNRPLKDYVTIITEEIPTGWGTTVFIPWEAYYEHVPLNGEDWAFAMIRWSPSDSPTWGGRVHQVGRFNVLDFEAPTAEQRTAIQKHVIRAAWDRFNATADRLRDAWLNGRADDERFFNRVVQPMIDERAAYGADIARLDQLGAEEIDALYAHIASWFELRYDAEEARMADVKARLFRENAPPTVTDATYTLKTNTFASGYILGTDPDGDPLTYSLGEPPVHGTASVAADGVWTYVPDADFAGYDQFTVIAADPSGATATATVYLIVTPGPATALALDPAAPDGDNGWYVSDVTATLTAEDPYVGVAETWYRLNGGDWLVYDGPFTIGDEGVHTLEFYSVDLAGIAEDVQSAVVRIDKTAPTISVVLDKTVLSPPNHKMVPITATVTVNDDVSGVDSFVLTSITSNEPDNGTGDGNTTNDIQDAEFGTPDTSFSLRAERSGNGNGRVYTITYTVTDFAGHTATATATVTVPKGNGN